MTAHSEYCLVIECKKWRNCGHLCQESTAVKTASLKPAAGQNVTLHVSPAARNFTCHSNYCFLSAFSFFVSFSNISVS